MKSRFAIFTLVAAAAAAACTSVPERNAALDQARAHFNSARTEAPLLTHAPAQLERAGVALALAEAAQARGAAGSEVDHLAYLADRRVTIAQEMAADRTAQAQAAGSRAESDRLRLALRTQEADAARLRAAVAEQDSARKSAELDGATRDALEDRRRLTLRGQEAESARQRATVAEQDSARKSGELEWATRQAREDQLRLGSLEQQLNELKARKTERGIVVTLGDMLFDTGQARLRATGARNVVNLADFMKRNPQRSATIEGFTDSVGTPQSNQMLSDQRAQTVMQALVSMGVAPTRLSARGLGEEQPVADNATVIGRSMNRRVEVLFSPADGDILQR
jgi:outer membrane protein OmpA-like peptidoglycan-associated protein